MATKTTNETTPFNTLDHAQSVLMENLTMKLDPNNFKSQAEVEKFLSTQFKHLMKLGNYSYDPTIGEVVVSFTPDLNVYKQLPDGRQISTIVHDYFTEQGWDSVIIIPGRTGAHNALVRLRHPTITSNELSRQGSRVERAIDSALAR
ncbi:MAG TPA: hypothetical protein VF905_03235 [Nitrospirota bacterium]